MDLTTKFPLFVRVSYIWSICSNGSSIKRSFPVSSCRYRWNSWNLITRLNVFDKQAFLLYIYISLLIIIAISFNCAFRVILLYTHNLNVDRCDVPIERQPLIRGASWKVHDRTSSNVNVWWTGKTENRISFTEGEERSSGERESRFIHEFSVRWRRKITAELRVSNEGGERERKKKNIHFDFPPHFSVERAHLPLPPSPSPGKYLSGILFPRNLFPLTHPL